MYVMTIDYRCESCDKKKCFGELRGDLGASRWVLTPSFMKAQSIWIITKYNVQPGNALDATKIRLESE
jgi:hypothetical protein